jgi:hypothetical protein
MCLRCGVHLQPEGHNFQHHLQTYVKTQSQTQHTKLTLPNTALYEFVASSLISHSVYKMTTTDDTA